MLRNAAGSPWSSVSLLFLLLGLSVLAWGTSYKLSLYKHNAPGSVAPATLCKLTSENAKSELDHVLDGHRVLAAVLLIHLAPASREMAFVVRRQANLQDARSNLKPLRVAPVLYLRPPPAGSFRLFQ